MKTENSGKSGYTPLAESIVRTHRRRRVWNEGTEHSTPITYSCAKK